MFGTRKSPRTTRAPRATRHTTTTTKPSLMSRLTGGGRTRKTHTTTTTTHHTTAPRAKRTWGTRRTAPVVQQRRKTSVGDKIAGALKKVQGSLTHNPAKKAAGTRRMHGTDGRGSRRVY